MRDKCSGLAAASLLVLVALALSACGRSTSAPSSEKVVNVYNWSDYIDPSVVPAFEKEYGIKVNYDVFDSNEVVETKLLAGHTGYDVVVPSASFLQRQIQAGAFQKLDQSQLPNLKNLDPDITRRLTVNDPGNQYGVIYLWGTSGIGYNQAQIAAALPDAPVDSFAMFFDPTVIAHFKDCGVSILDAPDEMVSAVLLYLGRNPNSEAAEDLQAAERVLLSIRPYVRYVNSSKYIEDLANGEICLALGWSGDVEQARDRARQAGKSVQIEYHLASQGAIMFFDMLAIPADAPHPGNAYRFINYLLRPEIAAKNSAAVHYATANAAAYALLDPAVRGDPSVYPNVAEMAHLHPNIAHGQAYTRELNRTWTRFKTGT